MRTEADIAIKRQDLCPLLGRQCPLSHNEILVGTDNRLHSERIQRAAGRRALSRHQMFARIGREGAWRPRWQAKAIQLFSMGIEGMSGSD